MRLAFSYMPSAFLGYRGSTGMKALGEWRTLWLVGAACLAGFLGSYFGAKVVKKVTLHTIRYLVATLLFVAAAALGAGIV